MNDDRKRAFQNLLKTLLPRITYHGRLWDVHTPFSRIFIRLTCNWGEGQSERDHLPDSSCYFLSSPPASWCCLYIVHYTLYILHLSVKYFFKQPQKKKQKQSCNPNTFYPALSVLLPVIERNFRGSFVKVGGDSSYLTRIICSWQYFTLCHLVNWKVFGLWSLGISWALLLCSMSQLCNVKFFSYRISNLGFYMR